MVHFPGFARVRLWIHRTVRRFCRRGFPHSEISGSKPACGSPKLIAACHVLLRLFLPRHPPCALSSLTIKLTRHTAAYSATTRRVTSRPSPPAHRTNLPWAQELRASSAPFPVTCRSSLAAHSLRCSHTSRIEALIKFTYSLVDCPIYSVIKHRPRQRQLTLPASAGLDCLQPKVRRQATINETVFDTYNGCRNWRPTLRWTLAGPSAAGLIRINSAFDLCDPLHPKTFWWS
jgi:hypothetical protein